MKLAGTLAARPLAWLALAAITGIALEDAASVIIPPWTWAAGALVTMLWMRRLQAVEIILLLTMCVFAFRHAVENSAAQQGGFRQLLEQRTSPLDVVVEGRVIKPLRRDLPGTEPGQALFVSDTITAPYIGKKWPGSLQLHVMTGKEVDLAPGRYRMEGRAMLPRPPDNPGQFDERGHDLRLGFAALLHTREIKLLEADAWSLSAWLDAHAQKCREWVKATLNSGMGGDDAAHKIILATVLGGAEAEARDLEQPFRATGTLHIFAVSGLHVGIVGFILWRLLKPFGLRRVWMTLIIGVLLFGYAFVTGLRPSTVRAAVMAVVLLSGELWQRRADMLNSLGAAALILLTLDSNQLFSIGFQLSFGVITSIALLNRPLLGLLRPFTGPDDFMPEVLLSPLQRVALNGRRWLAGAVSISTASWIGSLPFCVRHFQLVTPVALLANVVLVPVAFLILATAILTFSAALLHLPGIPVLLGNAGWAFARFALFSAKMFAAIPGGYFYLELPSFHLKPDAELTVLRLSRGAAAQHLRTSGANWLFDCGGAKDYDRLLRQYLNHTGVNHIHGLAVSHADSEHLGAAPFLVRDYSPDRLLLSSAEAASRSVTLRGLKAMDVHPEPMTTGDVIRLQNSGLPAKAEVLFPPPKHHAARADDRAAVLRLCIGPFRILWCNDAGFTTEKFMVEKLPPEAARCDVLVRNQNQKDLSLIPEFLNRANPAVIISTNSSFPEEQKLPQRIRDACAARKIVLLDQAETGAVTLRFWPQTLKIVQFRNPSADLTLAPRQDSPR